MKLYNVPDNTKIKIDLEIDGEKVTELDFKYNDCMYSHCYHGDKEIILPAWTEVKI